MGIIFEKQKTILEIEAQDIINNVNILVITFLSIIISLWLSEDIIIKSLILKIILSTGSLIVCMVFKIILTENLRDVKRRIELL